MDFVDTFESLKNYVINNRLAKSLEKATILTPSNGIFTIDPNVANMFVMSVIANSTIVLSTLTNTYTRTGSVISVLLNKSSPSYTVTWPSNIKWSDNTAPELSDVNLITLLNFGGPNTSYWYGGCININGAGISNIDPQMTVAVNSTNDDVIRYSQDAVISVTLPNDATGNLTIIVESLYNNTIIANSGQNTVNVTTTYNGSVSYSGDSKYLPQASSFTFTAYASGVPGGVIDK